MRDTFKNKLVPLFFQGLSQTKSFLGLARGSAALETVDVAPTVNSQGRRVRRRLTRVSRPSAAELSRSHAVELVRHLQAAGIKGTTLTSAEMQNHYAALCARNGWTVRPWPGPGSVGQELGRICRRGSKRVQVDGKMRNLKAFVIPHAMVRPLRSAFKAVA